MKKTVYILGAGFSKPAGAPLQNEIISEIIKLRDRNFGANQQKIISYLNEFENFLRTDLCIDDSEFHSVALEDVFTPIDRCIIDDMSFRSYENKRLVELREKIYSLIILAIKERLLNSPKGYINEFAQYLQALMKPRKQNIKYDPVSVISTNWDILLDNSIKSYLDQDNENGVVDYCCYVSSLQNDDTIKPGLRALGEGGYNVKLLKLHGSMNWLSCPKCQRLFVEFHTKIAEYGIHGTEKCKYCKNGDDDTSSTLGSQLIMPTFLKNLNNFQIKLIWQNAGVELFEASKIVFIGYSLPSADYELRQLLSRMVPHKAEIEVVMRNPDSETTKEKKQACDKGNKETLSRYKSFFGKRNVVPNYLGVEDYIKQLV